MQAAWAAAATGGWAFMVALAVYAYGEGGAAAVGLAALVRMVPAGLAAPLLGKAADRFPRRDVLLASTLARAVLLGALALAAALHAFPLVLVLAALFTVAQAAHKPAQAALIPRLGPHAEAANALWTTIDNAAFILGALAGGALVATTGAPVAFAAAALTFLLATVLLANIKRDCPSLENSPPNLKVPGTFKLAGLDRRAKTLVGVLSVSTLIEGMVDVLVVVTALELVHVGEAGVGWLNGAWGVGGVVGGVLAVRLARRGLPLGGLLIGAPLVALAALPSPVAALLALTALGVGYSPRRDRGHHAPAAPDPRRAPRAGVRGAGVDLLADDGRRGDARPAAHPHDRRARRPAHRRRRAPADPAAHEACAAEGRHCRTSGSGVSSGSTCSRRCSNSGGSASDSPNEAAGSSVAKPGPIVAISYRIPPGSRE